MEDLSFKPYYSTARDRVVKPAEVLPLTRYFVRAWQRYLDRDEFKLVITLRSLALDRGSSVDGIPEIAVSVSLNELADVTGISVANLKRKLSEKNLGNSHLGRFVRKEPQYRILPELGMARKIANAYFIQMDDPVAPHDQLLVREQMDEIESLLSELQRTGGLTHELLEQLRAHTAHREPQHRDQDEPSHRAQAALSDGDQDDPGTGITPTRKGSTRAYQDEPQGTRKSPLNVKDSIETTTLGIVSSRGSNKEGGRKTIDPEARAQSQSRSRAMAQIDSVATECAARLSDLGNIGYYRRRAGQLYAAGHLQLMLTVLSQTETAVREKAATDPVEKPGAYFNRLLEVEMTKRKIPLEHYAGDRPSEARRIARQEFGKD